MTPVRMPLAYTFWHQPCTSISPIEYEAGMRQFHDRLATVPIPGFVDSWTLRVPHLPWLPDGGYEDWYLVDDFAALGTLAENAVDRERAPMHDTMARAVRDGAGGVYALLAGPRTARTGWCGWFRKQPGVGYPALRAELSRQIDEDTIQAVWQRQLVLGPAAEFRILAPGPVTVAGAELAVGVHIVRSG